MLKAITTASPIAIFVVDDEGCVRIWNPAAERLFGWREQELVGSPHPVVLAESCDEIAAPPARRRPDEPMVAVEVRSRRRDGTPIDLVLSTAPLRDDRGEMIGRVHFAADAPARRPVEEGLRESVQRHELLTRSAPVGIFATDAQGDCLYVNPCWCGITGLSVEEALGQGWARALHPEDRERMFAEWERAARSGQPFAAEYRFQRADGITTWVLGQAHAHRDQTGAIAGYVGTITDLTERKRAERQQFVQGAITALLGEATSLAALAGPLLETIGSADDWAFAELWCLDTDDALLRRAGRWESAPFQAVTAGEEPPTPLATGLGLAGRVFASGQPIWISDIDVDPVLDKVHAAVGIPIRDAGQVSAVMIFFRRGLRPADEKFVAFLTDIAARVGHFLQRTQTAAALRASEEQVRRLQKLEAVGRLAAGIAHDFNNLLTVITGRAQILRDRLGPGDSSYRDLNLIQETAERAALLTKQILAFSRKQVLTPEVFDVNAVVSGMTAMLRRLIGEHIDLIFRPTAHPARVNADRGQIEQVIINLAVNARDAMPHGGRLTIETVNVDLDADYARRHAEVQPGPYVILAVSDTGVGMDAETQTRIFEPFFTTKGPDGGTGLGLATVYGIVRQSGGTIWLYSEPGRGTSFKIYLPRVTGQRQPSELATPPPGRGTETVLLVEDEDGVRELAREILEKYGYTVLEAAKPEDALSLAERHAGSIALLVTDMVMPRMSGRTLAAAIARHRTGIRVLYMSGFTDDAIVRDGTLERSAPFLQKPFTPVALAQKVRDVLDATHTPCDKQMRTARIE